MRCKKGGREGRGKMTVVEEGRREEGQEGRKMRAEDKEWREGRMRGIYKREKKKEEYGR